MAGFRGHLGVTVTGGLKETMTPWAGVSTSSHPFYLGHVSSITCSQSASALLRKISVAKNGFVSKKIHISPEHLIG